ncbi:MAG: antibiotic biosynthesis monooxygenase [Xanthobacteraceae bacterium]|nr:antibiotic biosynthesis monooxygenase [Xanthobacteraceae bacterium]
MLTIAAFARPAPAQETPGGFVRIAELDIDAAQLDAFKAAIRESIETAVRVEPGVLALYAISDKHNPARITVFEIYADAEAYRTHLETPHFRQFRDTTDRMVRSRKLSDAVPLALGAKPR